MSARTGDYFHGVPAAYEQKPGAADLPGPAHIDWLGVRAIGAPPPAFAGVKTPAPAARAAIDPDDYMAAQTVHHLRPDVHDDGLA